MASTAKMVNERRVNLGPPATLETPAKFRRGEPRWTSSAHERKFHRFHCAPPILMKFSTGGLHPEAAWGPRCLE